MGKRRAQLSRVVSRALAGVLAIGAAGGIGAGAAHANATGVAPGSIDPLTARVETRDAERFAALYAATRGAPSAAQIQAQYLDGASEGVAIFTPGRITSAERMAARIAERRPLYDAAVTRCLPWVADSNGDLRSIYLALKGLLPDRPLPRIYMVVGAANSGGTAGPGAQVLGLEILCRDAPTPAAFRDMLRTFFAHETAHTFQGGDEEVAAGPDRLLASILHEGVADYIAMLVTGASPHAGRDAYGRANEAALWAQFQADRSASEQGRDAKGDFDAAGQTAFLHWLYNGGSDGGRLPGWEADMGYWLGMRIAEAYVARSADKRAAIATLLTLRDPARILADSGYAGAGVSAAR